MLARAFGAGLTKTVNKKGAAAAAGDAEDAAEPEPIEEV